MVLDTDYSVSSVRVVAPETKVRSVRTVSSSAVGNVACSGHSAYGGSSHLSASSPARVSSSTYTSYSKGGGKSVGFGAGVGGGISSGIGSSIGIGSSVGMGGGIGGGIGGRTRYGSGGDNDYYVKLGGANSYNRTAQALSSTLSGAVGFGDSRPISSSPSNARQRQLSGASQRQHEETATIVTKVIREDTTGMEARIKELGVVSSDLQNSLQILIEQTNSEQNFVKERIEGFVSVTSDIRETLNELTIQLTNMSSEMQSISHEVRSCDERIVSIDRTIEAKLVSFRQEITDRDMILEQIRQEVSNREGLLADQTKQLRELEECRHSLFHAEESIKQKEVELESLDKSFHALGHKFEQFESETVQYTEVITTLENDLDTERRGRQDSERQISGMQHTLLQLEQALDVEKQNTQNRDREFDNLQTTIQTLETTITDERKTYQASGQELAHIEQAMVQLEARLEEERRGKQESERELNNLQHLIETVTREKQMFEQENITIKQRSQTDLDSLTQMLERLTSEKIEIEEFVKRERRKSDQLQESMSSLRMILEEEQRKSEENERKIQNFDRVIKETQEMYMMKESEFEMLKEEIGHYKNLVATKEKELFNLTQVFNENMSENKVEVGTLRQEIKDYKIALREKEFRLREYKDMEILQKAVASSETTTTTSRSKGSSYRVTGHATSGAHHAGAHHTGVNLSGAHHTGAHHTGGHLSGGGGYLAGGGYHKSGSSASATLTGRSSPCRSPSPTLGYCQTHKSIVSLDSRASVGACGTSCNGKHGILNIRYADPCTKIYPSKDHHLQVTNIYQGKKSSRPIRLCDDKS